jgi:putative transposase
MGKKQSFKGVQGQGLKRQKRRRRFPGELRKPLEVPNKLNQVWSMDFMSDSLIDDRNFRVLNIIDDHNRESVCTKEAMSYPSRRVIGRT